jgi:NAD(P)-dependent dehydrogenase (short-subunit alcohol dehydrogenase family)
MGKPRVVLVTGASRGAGKGIALALGAKGDIVYVTGRSRNEGDAPLPGTIDKTAAEITQRGGKGIAVACDHGDAEQIRALFAQIKREQGRLDILVNNATVLHDDLTKPGPFWEKSLDLVNILDVGLRSAYIAAYYAAPLLLANQRGLLVNTSSFGARCYMHGAAYGAQKSGLDKMAHDMAHDFKPYNVAAVSIWMGMLRTERTERVISAEPDKYAHFAAIMETPQLTGLVIDALYRDPELMSKTGRTLIGAEEAQHYAITDINGTQPPSHRPMLGDPITWSSAVVE